LALITPAGRRCWPLLAAAPPSGPAAPGGRHRPGRRPAGPQGHGRRVVAGPARVARGGLPGGPLRAGGPPGAVPDGLQAGPGPVRRQPPPRPGALQVCAQDWTDLLQRNPA
ncbi:unnamed protein product, partial [Heterosigma akashiwo]